MFCPELPMCISVVGSLIFHRKDLSEVKHEMQSVLTFSDVLKVRWTPQ